MKFFHLDLAHILPNGVPINTSSTVENRGFINAFFLRGFEAWWSSFFSVSPQGKLEQDYSRSCAAPSSLSSCMFCTDAQLLEFIGQAGFPKFTGNSHETNAGFLFDANIIQPCTNGALTSVARYVLNNAHVKAFPVYAGKEPFHYGIYFVGDITGSDGGSVIIDRLVDALDVIGTAHTVLDEVILQDSTGNLSGVVACACYDVVSYSCALGLPLQKGVYDVWLLDKGTNTIAIVSALKDVSGLGISECQQVVDKTPTNLRALQKELFTDQKSADEFALEIKQAADNYQGTPWDGVLQVI